METQKQDLGCRVSALEENFTEDRKTMRELQTQVQGLKISLEKALNSLMPKIDSLLIDRTNSVKTVSTVSAPVAIAPNSVLAPFVANSKANEKKKLPSTSSMPLYFTTSPFEAAEVGDIATLLSHLKTGTSANQRNERGFTLLHVAVSGGQENTVKVLLDAAASVNARGLSYRTSLHLAAEKGFLKIVEMLLVAGADTNAKDANNITPLMLAAKGGHSDVVNFLIEKGASLNDCDKQNHTALYYAVQSGANDLVKILCDKGASENQNAEKLGTVLNLASETGNSEAVMLLLQSKNPPNNEDIRNALSKAKDVCVVFAFEDAKPGILKTEEAGEALTMAGNSGRVHTKKALLDAGVLQPSQTSTIPVFSFHASARKYLIQNN